MEEKAQEILVLEVDLYLLFVLDNGRFGAIFGYSDFLNQVFLKKANGPGNRSRASIRNTGTNGRRVIDLTNS